MPSGSTPTFVYKSATIGMGLRAHYRVPYEREDTPIDNTNIIEIRDTKRHGACCNISYHDLQTEDVSPIQEEMLRHQFPRFSNRIHHLIEERREYRERPQQRSGNCTIL